MKTYNDEPNFSIVLPGPCNANCDFCFWEEKKACDNYLEKLANDINNLGIVFSQCSLTGGEPALSPVLFDVLDIVSTTFNKVVLTTNGTNFLNILNDQRFPIFNNESYVNISNEFYVNISRHHYDDEVNAAIFRTNNLPDTNELEEIIEKLNMSGIEANCNCVLTDNLSSKDEIEKMIEFAKNCGFSSIAFRNQHGTLNDSDQQGLFEDYKVIGSNKCPVCASTIQRIKGMQVIWKSSASEPDEIIDDDVIFELVYQSDGTITSDWEGKNEIYSVNENLMTKGEVVDNAKRQLVGEEEQPGYRDISRSCNIRTGC